jgi:hypothetical protein
VVVVVVIIIVAVAVVAVAVLILCSSLTPRAWSYASAVRGLCDAARWPSGERHRQRGMVRLLRVISILILALIARSVSMA